MDDPESHGFLSRRVSLVKPTHCKKCQK
uniref:Uncharacterized protein n=1 Tax=Anguilla anguilla TaxID=7936 RepID=A0A0E9TGN7_ANGAN